MADQNCPTCGAPCTTDIEPRGGDYGWSTSDKERTTYSYTPKTTLDSFIDDVEAADVRDAALWREWVGYLRNLQRKPFDLAMAINRYDAAMKGDQP